ncbi:MAG: SNF2-related protein [Capnocytophaga sp.]|nr:SNF2-related protein [Capnocytophaga sp.]
MYQYLLCFDFSFHPEYEVYLPSAYVARANAGSWYIFKKATADVLRGIPELTVSAQEDELLSLTANLQPEVLNQTYAGKKHKSVTALFGNKNTKSRIQNTLESKTGLLIEKIAVHQIPMSVNLEKSKDFDKYRIQTPYIGIQPLLEFEKTETGIQYRMLFVHNEQRSYPKDHRITLLNNECRWIVIDRQLARLTDIDPKKISPFLNKNEVFIPEKMIATYFDSFLKEILKKVEINAIGFDMNVHNQLLGVGLYHAYDFFAHHHKFYLGYDYGGYIFYSNQTKSSHSLLTTEEEHPLQINQYKRHPEAEQSYNDKLAQHGFHNQNGLFATAGENNEWATFHVLSAKETVLKSLGFSFDNLKIDGKTTLLSAPVLSISETTTEHDWFDLHINILHGDNTIQFKDLVKNIREENPVFELPDGSIFLIPQEWFARFGSVVKYLKINKEKTQLSKSHYALLNELPELHPKITTEKVIYQPSPNLKASLRPYQIEGAQWLLDHHHNGLGACLADDMGLGKTLQTLAVLVAVHDTLPEVANNHQMSLFAAEVQRETLKALVILPSSLVFNWYDETKRFAPHFRCIQYVGSDRKRLTSRLLNYDVVFTSYPIIARDANLLAKYQFRYIILDESQRIKNKDSQTFKAINKINATHKISLSGTPIENSLNDLWSQMQFINPGILGSYAHFSRYFKNGIEKKNDPVVLEELKTIINPFLLRRTKEQVLDDLPEMTEQTAYCEMSDEQGKWYNREKSKVRNQLLQIGTPITQFNALNMLMRLRQISNHPLLLDPESNIPSGKYEEVVNRLESILQSGQKALIFSSFVKHLSIFEHWCDAANIRYSKITGEVEPAKRKGQVEAFQNEASVRFFFISLKAGEVGLNLTAASHVLLLDPWWNPFSERQAIARAHRLGQKNKVNVIRFVSQNTIEEKIIRLQESKKRLSENIVDENTIINEVIENLDELLG